MPPFKHLEPGEKLVLSAMDYNAMVDMARAWYAEERNMGGADQFRRDTNTSVPWVRNDAGWDAEVGDVLQVDLLLTKSSDDLDLMKFRPLYSVVEPFSESPGQLVVASEPIPKGKIGRAVAVGMAVAKITDYETASKYAQYDWETGYFRAATSGHRIFAIDQASAGDDGTRWCVLLVGLQHTAPPPSGFFAKIIQSEPISYGSSMRWRYEIQPVAYRKPSQWSAESGDDVGQYTDPDAPTTYFPGWYWDQGVPMLGPGDKLYAYNLCEPFINQPKDKAYNIPTGTVVRVCIEPFVEEDQQGYGNQLDVGHLNARGGLGAIFCFAEPLVIPLNYTTELVLDGGKTAAVELDDDTLVVHVKNIKVPTEEIKDEDQPGPIKVDLSNIIAPQTFPFVLTSNLVEGSTATALATIDGKPTSVTVTDTSHGHRGLTGWPGMMAKDPNPTVDVWHVVDLRPWPIVIRAKAAAKVDGESTFDAYDPDPMSPPGADIDANAWLTIINTFSMEIASDATFVGIWDSTQENYLAVQAPCPDS